MTIQKFARVLALSSAAGFLWLSALHAHHYYGDDGVRRPFPLSDEAATFIALSERAGLRDVIVSLLEEDASVCDLRRQNRLFEVLSSRLSLPSAHDYGREVPSLVAPVADYVLAWLHHVANSNAEAASLLRRVRQLGADDWLRFLLEVYSAPIFTIYNRVVPKR